MKVVLSAAAVVIAVAAGAGFVAVAVVVLVVVAGLVEIGEVGVVVVIAVVRVCGDDWQVDDWIGTRSQKRESFHFQNHASG